MVKIIDIEAVGLPRIDPEKPIETYNDLTVTGLRADSHGRLVGAVLTGNGSFITLAWDQYGLLTDGYRESLKEPEKFHIQNVEEKSEVAQTDWKLTRFHDDLYSSQGYLHGIDFTQSVVSGDYGFVLITKGAIRQWEVWDMADDFGLLDKLPPCIPATEIADFYVWLLARDGLSDDEGYIRGFQEGEQAFQRKLRDLAGLGEERSDDDE